MLDAARRLIDAGAEDFTTQELAAEAGISQQTFYRYFASKDQLLLALIGDVLAESSAAIEKAGANLIDPVSRLKHYIDATLDHLAGETSSAQASRFVTSASLRLHRQFAHELAETQKPFVELMRREVEAGVDAGLLSVGNPRWAAWFTTELVRSVYHYFIFIPEAERDVADLKKQLWEYCGAALGVTSGGCGTAESAKRSSRRRAAR